MAKLILEDFCSPAPRATMREIQIHLLQRFKPPEKTDKQATQPRAAWLKTYDWRENLIVSINSVYFPNTVI